MDRVLAAAAALILIGATQSSEPPHTPAAQAVLDKWLTGRVAGETRTCLPMNKTNNPIGVDNFTMLFRDGPRIWRNNLRRGSECEKVGKPYALVSSAAQTAGRLCTGAVVGIVDMHDPTVAVGACELGDFTVYEKP
jgi:hypothetical protein